MTGKKEVNEYKSDDKTHRFMDRNRPKGLRKNSNKDKRERYLLRFKSTANHRRNKHGRTHN